MAKRQALWLDQTVDVVVIALQGASRMLGILIEQLQRRHPNPYVRYSLSRASTQRLMSIAETLVLQASLLDVGRQPAEAEGKKPRNILKDRVERLLHARNWSQTELASKSGVNTGTISRLLSGMADSMNIDNLARIADALETSTDWLLGRE